MCFWQRELHRRYCQLTHDINSGSKYVAALEEDRSNEVKEWFAWSDAPCYFRLCLIHPVTQKAYVEFITKYKDLSHTKSYISSFFVRQAEEAENAEEADDSESDDDMIGDRRDQMMRLKPGQTRDLLLELASKAFIFEVRSSTEIATSVGTRD